MRNIHIMPTENCWSVEHAGGGDGTTFPSQAEAIQVGTEQAKREKVEVLIHNQDGQILERNSFCNDSRDINE